MATSTIVWIIVAVVAVVVIVGVLLWMARTQRDRRRAAQAEELRDHVRQESVKVQRREALADETAARAQAEADAKAAEAARLQERADTHRTEATTSRDRLDEKWAHADSLDPRAQSVETSQTTDDGVRENGGPLDDRGDLGGNVNEAPRTSPAPGRGN